MDRRLQQEIEDTLASINSIELKDSCMFCNQILNINGHTRNCKWVELQNSAFELNFALDSILALETLEDILETRIK